ncbi:MAG: DUF4192 domain-containing protein, partial [Actinomycetota bacterium]|nr:DUF4192 domain-containing protein [Actinomycetota bacterium]
MSRTNAEGLGSHGVELRVAGPDDLLHAVPYLLGFHPADSLVLVGLRASQLVVTVRVSLSDLARPDVLADAMQASTRAGVTELVGAIYLPTDAAYRVGSSDCSSLQVVGVLRAAAAEAGLTVLDMLLVHDGRWRSAWCARDCCPAEGTPLGETTSVFAAAATYAGMAVLPDRAAMMSVLDPRSDRDRARLSPLIAEAENAMVRAALDGQGERCLRSVKRAVFAAARTADAAIRAADADLV